MRRREFITLVGGGAATWPLRAKAQQPNVPVVGYLTSGSRLSVAAVRYEAAFLQGLGSMGFDSGRNLVLDYRTTENQMARLSGLAADLVQRKVTVIYAGDNAAAVAAKATTDSIPIVFRIGSDPVLLGLVRSLSRPDANVTGVSFLQTTTTGIRVQMLHEAVPQAAVIGLLVKPGNPNAEPEIQETHEAAQKLGLELQVVSATTASEIDGVFPSLKQQGVQALIILGDPLFSSRAQQLATLSISHGMPAIYALREHPDAGGLTSYGGSAMDASRLAGIYVGRILKGDKPNDLPVQQSTKVELVLNLIAAKALGITYPITLLGRADEVIE
jgi:putative ABC transport system substrate-binding protein